jgi:N-acetylmuramoyl-L-alanine amidase
LVAVTTQEKAVPTPSQTKPETGNVNNGINTETEIENNGNSNTNTTGDSSAADTIQLPCPARISSPTVNFRSGPGSDTAVVTKLAQGTRVEALRQDGSWLEVKLINGSVGWVASWLVKLIGKTNRLEIGIDTGEQNKITILGSEPLVYEVNEQPEPNRLVVKIRDAELAGNAQDIAVGQYGLVKVSTGAVEGDNTSVQVNLELEPGFRWFTKPGDNERMLLIVPTESKVGDVQSETGQNGTNSGNSQVIHTVAIDPGHGGIDPGALGVNKLQEKDVVFDISKRVGLKLESAGYRVIYTRTDDTKITLTQRPAIALENKADIFVSVHANASENSTTNGTSTYYYAPSSIPELAAQGPERIRLAQAVQNQMIKAVGRKDLGIKQENFSVLRGTTMPSILVETAYLSYREEEDLLAKEEIRGKFAQAIFEGIKQYFEEYQPAG